MYALRLPQVRVLALAALALLAFAATRLIAAPLAMRFGDAPVLPVVLDLSRWAALLAAGAVLIAAALVVLPVALARSRWPGRLAAVVPAVLVCLVAVGFKMQFFEIGTLGAAIELPLLGRLTFAQTWVAVTAILALAALPWAAARSPEPLGGPAATRAVARVGAGAVVAAACGLVLALGWLAGAPPPVAGGPGGGGPGGPGDAPSLVPLAIGTVVTLGLALLAAAGAASWRAPSPAVAVDRAIDRPRDVGGMVVAMVAVLALGFVAIQAVPVTRDNPPAATTPPWDDPATAALWDRTCAACHSHDTRWPWYAQVAPASWLIAAHVEAGRADLNVAQLDGISENRRARLPDQLERVITSGRMPPRDFLLLHPEAQLTAEEQDQLIAGLRATFGALAE